MTERLTAELLIHGGDLVSASQRFGIAVEDWLDMSTGINPNAYPVGELAPTIFQHLPYQRASFRQAVEHYYLGVSCDEQADDLSVAYLATNGSQHMIQALPKLLPTLPVLLPTLGYQEHDYHWRQQQGVERRYYSASDYAAACQQIEHQLHTAEHENRPFHLVIINPNNPSGLVFPAEKLATWARKMVPGGRMIIDEAFIDSDPENSVLPLHFENNMIVLRSFGKFFGLAGLRLGFTFGSPSQIEALSTVTSAWEVNGPAQAIATCALLDDQWQHKAREDIQQNTIWTRQVIEPVIEQYAICWKRQTPLFLSFAVACESARYLYQAFAAQAVLVRLVPIDKQLSLVRVGIVSRDHTDNRQHLLRATSRILKTLDIKSSS